QQAPAPPAMTAAQPPADAAPTPTRQGTGSGITVPPLPPISGPVANGRRPLSNEDFEEELDIPEFLRQ
ncbi:MAG TPA: cell division protein FtsZ, partial [Blastococcus sp.]|nr:cell division protein FtsZ [Blastococcus sp.]